MSALKNKCQLVVYLTSFHYNSQWLGGVFCHLYIGRDNISNLLVTDADNMVWKTVFLVHVLVVLAGALYTCIMLVQLMSRQMKNPLRYEEGRCVGLMHFFVCAV